ncbi:MAG: cell wall anchor protein, partial [Muribaculaceae bacterium]|nr:cell wall anchor protein [Muribaculaceae bacterium]
LAALSNNNDPKARRGRIRQILDMADFVKFAKVRPLPPDNVKAMENAIQFVEETKPVAVVPEDDKKGGEK